MHCPAHTFQYVAYTFLYLFFNSGFAAPVTGFALLFKHLHASLALCLVLFQVEAVLKWAGK